jgi:hypothetical protein
VEFGEREREGGKEICGYLSYKPWRLSISPFSGKGRGRDGICEFVRVSRGSIKYNLH